MSQDTQEIFAAVSCLSDYDPNALTVDRAREIIAGLVAPLAGSERLYVRNALGRVLAADVIAPFDVPAHDNSAMDGYALRFADLASEGRTRLRLAGSAFAGQAFAGTVGAGECVRIMTGAMIPAGADCVVIQEAVRTEGDAILVPPGQKPGQHIRRAGEDVAAGHPALPAGKIISPADVGVLASLGIAEVSVKRRLRVAYFSTGDELCSVGSQLAPGEVYDSNRYTLHGMLARLGCDILDLGVVRDDPQALEAALAQALQDADVILTSGGVSVGDADFTREVLGRMGEVLFWKIAMKPGRPLAFGRIGHDERKAWFFGLPGNPVAVMVSFYQFAREPMLRMMGADPLPVAPRFPVPCVSALKKAPGRTEFQRGVLFREDGQWKVRPTGAQGSGILRSMAEANCFIVLGHDQGQVAPGDTVEVQMFDGLV